MVTVDHILHGGTEAVSKLRLEPLGELDADRVGQDDAFRCHQEHGVVDAVPSFIEITGDVDDFAWGLYFFDGIRRGIDLRGASGRY